MTIILPDKNDDCALADPPPPNAWNLEPFVARWLEDGPKRLRANHGLFRELLTEAHDLLAAGDATSAAAWCEIAGFQAAAAHSALFASPELEAMVRALAHRSFGDAPIPRGPGLALPGRRILHVATYVQPIGGLSRMIWRWIEADEDGVHSVALIRQRRAIPQQLVAAVKESGGKIHDLSSEGPADLFGLAGSLRRAAAGADLVVLHIDTRDIVPLLAFSTAGERPPIAYLDHADHAMWISVSIADIVIALRNSGKQLALTRRSVAPERSVLLPIPLPRIERTLTRTQAKRMLGIPEEALLLVSVARKVKYRSVEGASFADAHVPFLERWPGARLVVLGSGSPPEWAAAEAKVPGRIEGLPESDQTALYYQAADIYVDSFPFVSTTSLLEAGAYGTPLVSRYPFGPGAEILGADMPGLEGHLVRALDLAAYNAALNALAADPAGREKRGDATRLGITTHHQGPAWSAAVAAVYKAAGAVSPVQPAAIALDVPHLGSPDVFVPFVHGQMLSRDQLICSQLALMPPGRRMRHWLDLVFRHGLRFGGRGDLLKCWVPSRLVARIRRS
ncbi:glycosyltransferase family protein [Mesorhizobium sp. A623]